MANYYWVGAAGAPTEDTTARYDFNTPSNWRVQTWGHPSNSWPLSATAPGAGDSVFVGCLFPAQSPCLLQSAIKV